VVQKDIRWCKISRKPIH